MNQFFYQITRKASEIVNSDDYRKGNTAQLQSSEKHGIIGVWKHN